MRMKAVVRGEKLCYDCSQSGRRLVVDTRYSGYSPLPPSPGLTAKAVSVKAVNYSPHSFVLMCRNMRYSLRSVLAAQHVASR